MIVAALALGVLGACGASAPEVERAQEPPAPTGRLTFECAADEDAELGLIVLEECLSGTALEVARVVERALENELRPGAYLALWAPGGRWTRGRHLRPDACDTSYDASRYPHEGEAPREEDGSRIGMEGVRIVLDADRAVVAAGTLLVGGSGEDHVADGHRYELRREGGTWRIVSLRTWPISWGASDTGQVLGDAHWARVNADVDAARRALAEASAEARADALRALRSALSAALCPTEALEIARQVTALEVAWSSDWYARANLAATLFLDDEARTSREQAPRAALPPPAPWARRQLDCSDREDEDTEPCALEEVARVDATDPAMRPRSVAVLRIDRGQAGYHHRIAAGVDGAWRLGEEFAPGQGQGMDSLTLSAPELRQLEPGGDVELLFRFESNRTVEEQPRVERGWMACADLLSEPRCVRFFERVRWGGIPEATATVTFFADGTVSVRPGRGRSPMITAQRARLRDLLQ